MADVTTTVSVSRGLGESDFGRTVRSRAGSRRSVNVRFQPGPRQSAAYRREASSRSYSTRSLTGGQVRVIDPTHHEINRKSQQGGSGVSFKGHVRDIQPSHGAATTAPNRQQTRLFGGGAGVAYDGDQKLATATWSPVRDFVRRLAHRRLRRADLADDVAQETLLRLIEYQRGGRIDNLYGLATRIAENLVNEQFRRDRRWGVEGLSETLASGQPSPERVVEGREAVEVFKRALERMPRLRREIIIRRRIHCQSCAAIAEDLGLNVKAVEKHVTRGLLDLNKACGLKRRGWRTAH